MAKLILEFNLPEEREEAETTQKAGAYHSMLWEVAEYARTLRKYDERESIPTEEIVAKLHEILADFDY